MQRVHVEFSFQSSFTCAWLHYISAPRLWHYRIHCVLCFHGNSWFYSAIAWWVETFMFVIFACEVLHSPSTSSSNFSVFHHAPCILLRLYILFYFFFLLFAFNQVEIELTVLMFMGYNFCNGRLFCFIGVCCVLKNNVYIYFLIFYSYTVIVHVWFIFGYKLYIVFVNEWMSIMS